MRVLFVHQNFPAQYKRVSAALARDRNNDIVALAVSNHPVPEGVRVLHYAAPKDPPRAHPIAADFDTKSNWGVAAARAATTLKSEGFVPDLICGHPGWGEMMFLRDVWPDARTLSYMEFFFRSTGSDFGFDRSAPVKDPWQFYRLRARNAPLLMAIESSEWCVTPTRFQWQQLPDFARARTSVIHEGVDTEMFCPDLNASITLGRDKIVCRPGNEIVTFVARNLEPYRGFHTFMRALPEILSRRPQARAVIVGGDGVSYGPRPEGTTWKAVYTQEVANKLDFSRVHFVGKVPYSVFRKLLQVSAAHVYLTYPFVLSWSMLEAMSAECLVIGSSTPPVQEVIEHEHNGIPGRLLLAATDRRVCSACT